MSDNQMKVAAHNVAATIDQIAQDLYHGNLQAVGLCAVRSNGQPVYFYFDGTPQDRNTLAPAINLMVGLYADRNRFAGNAPATNRSYGTH